MKAARVVGTCLFWKLFRLFFNIPTSNRFDNHDAKINDIIEINASKARQIPFVKSAKSTVKIRPEVVINKYPENQHIFGKENINTKRRPETYTDALYGNIKKDNRKITMFTDSIPTDIWRPKLNHCADAVARLKSFPGATSN